MVQKWFQEKAKEEKRLSTVVTSELRPGATSLGQKHSKSKLSRGDLILASQSDEPDGSRRSPLITPILNFSKKLFTKHSGFRSAPQDSDVDENVVRMRILDVEDIPPNWKGLLYFCSKFCLEILIRCSTFLWQIYSPYFLLTKNKLNPSC